MQVLAVLCFLVYTVAGDAFYEDEYTDWHSDNNGFLDQYYKAILRHLQNYINPERTDVKMQIPELKEFIRFSKSPPGYKSYKKGPPRGFKKPGESAPKCVNGSVYKPDCNECRCIGGIMYICSMMTCGKGSNRRYYHQAKHKPTYSEDSSYTDYEYYDKRPSDGYEDYNYFDVFQQKHKQKMPLTWIRFDNSKIWPDFIQEIIEKIEGNPALSVTMNPEKDTNIDYNVPNGIGHRPGYYIQPRYHPITFPGYHKRPRHNANARPRIHKKPRYRPGYHKRPRHNATARPGYHGNPEDNANTGPGDGRKPENNSTLKPHKSEKSTTENPSKKINILSINDCSPNEWANLECMSCHCLFGRVGICHWNFCIKASVDVFSQKGIKIEAELKLKGENTKSCNIGQTISRGNSTTCTYCNYCDRKKSWSCMESEGRCPFYYDDQNCKVGTPSIIPNPQTKCGLCYCDPKGQQSCTTDEKCALDFKDEDGKGAMKYV